MSALAAIEADPSPWPDWSGQACAIIASGPSVKPAQIPALRGRLRVLAIKNNVDLAPWADALYGCDFAWWRHVRGAQAFGGLKMAWDRRACGQYGLVKVDLPDRHLEADDLLFGRTGLVGGGGCSGFQALNLAAQFGAARILLIGFDAHDRGGVHWYGRNMAAGQGNPNEGDTPRKGFRRWRTAFANAAKQLEALGVDVVNASPTSTLTAFRRGGIEETLQAWGL